MASSLDTLYVSKLTFKHHTTQGNIKAERTTDTNTVGTHQFLPPVSRLAHWGSSLDISWWLSNPNDLPHLLRHPGKYAHGHPQNQAEELIQPNKHFSRQSFCLVVAIMPDGFSNPLNTWPSCHCGSTEGTAQWSEEGPAAVNLKALPLKYPLRFNVKWSKTQQLLFKNITWSAALTQITNLHYTRVAQCCAETLYTSTARYLNNTRLQGRPVMNEKLGIVLH